MRLSKVTIEGYRSVRESVPLDLDGRITVVLGANDHGKSNALASILHLNPDHPFDPDTDVNWDLEEESDAYPRVEFRLTLTDDERAQLAERETRRARLAALDEFVGELDEIDNAAAEEEAAAERSRDEAREALEELRGEAPEDAAADAERAHHNEAVKDAEARLQSAEDDVAAAGRDHELTLDRYHLARAERIRVRHEIEGNSEYDIERAAASAEKAASSARNALKKASDELEAARAKLGEATSQFGAGTEQETAAQGDVDKAEQAVKRATGVSDAATREADQLKSAADAAVLAREGKLGFDAEHPLPSPVVVGLRQSPTTPCQSRRRVSQFFDRRDAPQRRA
jgi:chromosome segregation ATPase